MQLAPGSMSAILFYELVGLYYLQDNYYPACMKKFIGADREKRIQISYDLSDWLPEHHLSRFVVDIVDKLDMRGVYSQYKGVSTTAYDPHILLIGKELGLFKLGNIYIDGTQVQSNASRHKAMSYEYIQKLEKQIEEEKNISPIISTSPEKHNSFLSNILNPDPIDDAACVLPRQKRWTRN